MLMCDAVRPVSTSLPLIVSLSATSHLEDVREQCCDMADDCRAQVHSNLGQKQVDGPDTLLPALRPCSADGRAVWLLLRDKRRPPA